MNTVVPRPSELPSVGIYQIIVIKQPLTEQKVPLLPRLVIVVPGEAAVGDKVAVFHWRQPVGVVAEVLFVDESSVALKCLERCVFADNDQLINDDRPTEPHPLRDPLRRVSGRIRLFKDDPAELPSPERVHAILLEICTLLRNQLLNLGTAGRSLFEQEFGQVPSDMEISRLSHVDSQSRVTASADAERFSFWLANALDTRGSWPLILSGKSSFDRLRLLRDLLKSAGSDHSVLRVGSGRSWLRLRSGLGGVVVFLVVILSLWLKGRGWLH